jgi:CRP/FNR family transcriptional regulator, nitrogen oxide reductase regulator
MATSEFRAANCLPNVDIFGGMKPREIDLILAAAQPYRFSAKSVMTDQGDSSDHFLLMWKGRGRFFYVTPNGKKLILRWIKPGEIFGVEALWPRHYRYLASTEAVHDSVVLAWGGPTVLALGQRFPRLLENIVCVGVEYHSWHIAAHTALVCESARVRLANLLLALAPSIGDVVPDGIEIDVTNQELADSVNISLYTTSRIMSEWERIGAIRKRRGKTLLRSPRKLFRRVIRSEANKQKVAKSR